MTLDSLSLVLTHLESGMIAAQALIVPDARYVGVAAKASARIKHVYGTRVDWIGVLRQIAAGLDNGPIDRHSPIGRLVIDDEAGAVTAQYLARLPIEVSRPELAAQTLDDWLRRAAA